MKITKIVVPCNYVEIFLRQTNFINEFLKIKKIVVPTSNENTKIFKNENVFQNFGLRSLFLVSLAPLAVRS